MWILAVAVTFLLSWLLILPVKKLAWKIGAIDVPRDWRRMHRKPVPRAGGIAMFAALLTGCLLFCRHTPVMMAALEGGLLLMAMGLVDDIFRLPAWLKLLFQLVIAALAVGSLGRFHGVAMLFMVLWVVTLTNAHNFVDGLDGLFGGTSAIEGIALAFLLTAIGLRNAALPPLLVSAACAGFLVHNRPPARIFAGDCGSGCIGFVLGVLALPAFSQPIWQIGSLAPFLIFAYPLADMVTAVLRRILHGKSPFAADRGHLHHRICAIGVPQPLCTLLLLLLSAMMGTLGVLISRPELRIPAIVMVFLTVLLLAFFPRFLMRIAKNS